MIEALGGWDKLMEDAEDSASKNRRSATRAATKMIGTGGTSPFGAYGYNPEGIRIGQDKCRHGKAVKVWDKREYKNLDDTGRARHAATSRSRCAACANGRAKARATELDLPGTITRHRATRAISTCVMRAERHNTVKVLLFFDIGGSMDAHIKLCEELFSRRANRIQAHGFLLLPQLPLRERVEGQSPPPQREDADLGRAAQISARLQGRLRRRRDDEPLRDHLSGRHRSNTGTKSPAPSGSSA